MDLNSTWLAICGIRESEMLNQSGRKVYFSRSYFDRKYCGQSYRVF